MQWTIEATVEIAAPPEAVRAKFLNFADLPKWSPTGFIHNVSPIPPATELKLVPEERIECDLAMGKFKGTVVKNTPQEFAWCGSLPYVFTGTHHFHFSPSKTTPGGTTFTQIEYFSGALAWMMGDTLPARLIGMGAGTKSKWESFNQDLKREMEK